MKSEPTEVVKAYIAGIIDGEGWIGIAVRQRANRKCKTPSFVVSVAVSMTEYNAVELIAEFYEGSVSEYHREGKRSYKKFDATGTQVGELLESIKPYIRIKSSQLKLALQFLQLPTFRGEPVPEWATEIRTYVSDEMKKLNQHKGGD